MGGPYLMAASQSVPFCILSLRSSSIKCKEGNVCCSWQKKVFSNMQENCASIQILERLNNTRRKQVQFFNLISSLPLKWSMTGSLEWTVIRCMDSCFSSFKRFYLCFHNLVICLSASGQLPWQSLHAYGPSDFFLVVYKQMALLSWWLQHLFMDG